MFYILRGRLVVGKAEKQAIRWGLKVGQSAVSTFQMPVFLI